MEDSLRFYEEIVGLNIHERFQGSPGVEIVFLGSGETKVELIHDEKIKDIEFNENICLGFQVESLDNMMDFIKEKGLEIHSGPFEPNPYIKYFFVQDPNGLKIQFVESGK